MNEQSGFAEENGSNDSINYSIKRSAIKTGKFPASTANQRRLDPEKLLSAFGKYGKYQMRSYILLTAISFFYSSQMLIMGFITRAPPFQCIIEPTNISSIFVNYQMIDDCRVIDLQTDQVKQCLEIPNSKYLYREPVPYSTLNSEFDLVCNDQLWAEHGSSLFMIGGLFTPLITQLSDLYGRRIIFLFTFWSAGLVSTACSMAPTILTFLVGRFILGIATTGCYAITWIMCCESVSVEFRSLIPMAFTISWVFGVMMVGILRIWILNWRWLYFIISVPAVFTVFYYWILPESPHWLISQNKQRNIEQYIRDASLYNNMKINLNDCQSEIQLEDNEHKSRTFMDILRNKVALFHFIMQCYVMSAMNLSYWGMALLSTTLSEDGYTGYFLSGFIDLPAGFLAVLLLLKFGRRSVSVWSFLAQSVLLFTAVFLPGGSVMQMVLTVIAKLFNGIIWCAQPLLLAEMSPTTIRNAFFGAVQFFADSGSILAPYLYLLRNVDHRAPQAAVAVFSLIAAVVLLTAPETKDRPMPDDLDQFDPGYFLEMFGYRKQKRRNVLRTPKEDQRLREQHDEEKPLKSNNDEDNK